MMDTVTKHADEGAIYFWSKGTDWLTGVGYWPYGSPLMPAAYGWNGSNALHMSQASQRTPNEK
ncbi:MAG: heparinase II/III family protein [Rhodoferax sp.]|nr:heparinase II/III family protein [Rhodoferax sp.]